MKFLPPEDEIRAQLRELTSQTRRLRADLQGLINDRGHSNSAFARDHRRLWKRDTPSAPTSIPPPRPAAEAPAPTLKSRKTSSRR
jgi:hypothetical protein